MITWPLALVCIAFGTLGTVIICACCWTREEFFRWRDNDGR